jgi:ribosomal protein S18 acetylase RimI-like enzyme
MTPEPAQTSELAAAFRLLFNRLPPEDADTRVANALHLVQTGELDPRGVFVLRGGGGLLGAQVCLPVPGASALVWPPSCVEDVHARERENALLRHALGYLRQRGVKLAQALLAPVEGPLGASLERNGFVHITHLWYLQHNLEIPVQWLAWPARLEFEPYDRCDGAVFHETLARTYDQTQDCPEVNGVRGIEEVIVGHQSQGRYDPERWWLATLEGRPVGVMMLMELPETGDWDVSYMGVVPERRQQGFAREMLLRALFEARAADVFNVTLSVDGRNRPAWNLYRGVGFEPFDRREVYLAVFRG